MVSLFPLWRGGAFSMLSLEKHGGRCYRGSPSTYMGCPSRTTSHLEARNHGMARDFDQRFHVVLHGCVFLFPAQPCRTSAGLCQIRAASRAESKFEVISTDCRPPKQRTALGRLYKSHSAVFRNHREVVAPEQDGCAEVRMEFVFALLVPHPSEIGTGGFSGAATIRSRIGPRTSCPERCR